MRWRPGLVLLHRYAGLVMAAFLILAGVTGAPLAWYYELDAALNPQRRVDVAAQAGPPLHPLELRERVRRAFPGAGVNFVPLVPEPEGVAVFFITDPSRRADQVYVHPWTGHILDARRWGDIRQGWTNLMPFIYRLHYEVAAGTVGSLVFGIVALVWTLDCFAGAALGWPRRTAQAQGWRRALGLRWRAGAFKVNFDLHRAGGLWLWAWLFVFAWSSVAFNLPQAYYPVMHALFESQEDRVAPASRPAPAPDPALGWEAGLARGRQLMESHATANAVHILHEQRLSYRPLQGVFHYRVRSDRDIRDRRGTTSVDFDAATGELVAVEFPTGAAAGDTITAWLLAWHMADVWGQPFKVAVFLIGLATAGLSGTGVWIWWIKRRARRLGRDGLPATPDPRSIPPIADLE